MALWHDRIPAGAWPLLLPRSMAAAFVGVSENTFMSEVKQGVWPAPIRRGEKRRRYWSRDALAATVQTMAQSNGEAPAGHGAEDDDDDWTGLFDDDDDYAHEGHQEGHR